MRFGSPLVAATLLAFAGLLAACSGGPTDPPPLARNRVIISEPLPTLVSLGETATLEARVVDAAGAPVAAQVVWTSLDPATASMGGAIVTAVANGTARLVATSGDVADTASLVVAQQAVTIVLTAPSPIRDLGATALAGVTAVDARDQPVPAGRLTWTVADGSIASVSSTGVLTGRRTGQTVVTATQGAVTGQAPVAVDVGTWATRTGMPTPRKEIAQSAVAIGGEVFVAGGVSANGQISAALEIYDPITDSWRIGPPAPIAVWRAAAAAVDGKLYVVGGYLSTGAFPFSPTNRVFAYDPGTNLWQERAPAPTARGAAAAVALGGRLHVIGGSTSGEVGIHEVYDPVTNAWTALAPLPTPRSGLTAAVAEGRIVAIGGYRLAGQVISLGTVERFDPTTGAWTAGPALPAPRHGIAAATVGDRILVVGGAMSGPFVSQTLLLDAAGWRQLESMPVLASFAGLAAIGGVGYLFGGGPVNLDRFDAVARVAAFAPPAQ